MTINVVIIVDFMGSMIETPDQQVENLTKQYKELLAPNTLKITRLYSPIIPEGTDLLLYDFGGMLPGCSDLLESNARAIMSWAYDHPKFLAVIVSSWTYELQFAEEAQRMGLDTENIVCYDGSLEVDNRIRSFFGLTGKPEPESFVAHKLVNPGSIIEQAKRNLPGEPGALRDKIGPLMGKLPDIRFFNPNEKFFDWMAQFKDKMIYDVGAGCGHVTKLLVDHGHKSVRAIDLFDRETQEVFIDRSDGTTYPYLEGAVVMLCRPCHGRFPRRVIEQAVECGVSTILYISKPSNRKKDLAGWPKFRRSATRVGKDNESIYYWKLK